MRRNTASIIRSVGLGVILAIAGLCSARSIQAQSRITRTEISGKILGADGKPMPRAAVRLAYSMFDKPIAVVEADKDGNFHLSTDKIGLFVLGFVGVNHLLHTAVLMVEKPRRVTLNVRLVAPEYKEDFSEGQVFSEGSKPGAGIKLAKQPDGTYVAEFETKETSVAYIIGRVTKVRGTINGTQAEDYKLHDSGQLYFSVVTPVNGKVKIMLDPAKLPRSAVPAEVSFAEPASPDNRLNAIYQEMESRAQQKSDSPPAPEEITRLTERIAKERNPLFKKALWLNYLDLTLPKNKSEAALVSKALDALTPTSPLWVLRYNLLDKAVASSGQPDKYKGYVDIAVERFPQEVKLGTIGLMFGEAIKNKQTEKAEDLYRRLVQEFPDSPWTENARHEMDKGRTVIVGKMVPAFSAHSLDDPKVIYTNTNIKAKVYLIDFWATWCQPCVAEMPYLHRAYEKFHPKGFEILSYSVDSSREVVANFRKSKYRYPMPWLHAIDPLLREMDSDITRQFEVINVPSAFLVDASGKILAMRLDLQGERLEKFLTQILGEPDSARPRK